MTLTPKQKRKSLIILASIFGSIVLLIICITIFNVRESLAHRRYIYSSLTKGADWKGILPTDPPTYPKYSDSTEFSKIFLHDKFVGKKVKTLFFRVNQDSNENPILYYKNETEGLVLREEYAPDCLKPTRGGKDLTLNIQALSEYEKYETQKNSGKSSRGWGETLTESFALDKDYITAVKEDFLQDHAEVIYLMDPKATFKNNLNNPGDVCLYEYWWGDKKLFTSVKDIPKCIVAYVYCGKTDGGDIKYSDTIWMSVNEPCNKEELEICALNHVVVRKAFDNPNVVPWPHNKKVKI
jgi:hypothetical protein